MKGTYTITFRLDWVLSFRGGLGGSPVRLLADALRKEFPQAEISQDSANVVTMACGEAGKPEQEVRERIGACSWEVALIIPASTFFLHELGSFAGRDIRANFYKCGDLLQTPHFLSWNPIDLPKPDFHCPQFFGLLHLE